MSPSPAPPARSMDSPNATSHFPDTETLMGDTESFAANIQDEAIVVPPMDSMMGPSANEPQEVSSLLQDTHTMGDSNTGSQYDGSSDGEDESEAPTEAFDTTSHYKLRGHRSGRSKLQYDAKYHPMDDVLRPSHAATRRLLYGEDTVEEPENDVSLSEVSHQSVHDGRDDDTDYISGSRKQTSGKRKRRLDSGDNIRPTKMRRSTRPKPNAAVIYDMNVHPQDDFLRSLEADPVALDDVTTGIMNELQSTTRAILSQTNDLSSIPDSEDEDENGFESEDYDTFQYAASDYYNHKREAISNQVPAEGMLTPKSTMLPASNNAFESLQAERSSTAAKMASRSSADLHIAIHEDNDEHSHYAQGLHKSPIPCALDDKENDGEDASDTT